MTALTMVRGDTRIIQETISNLTSTGLTGCSLWLTAKHDATDPDSAAVFQKKPSDWTVTTVGNASTSGVATCTINPADTASLLPFTVILLFDVQLKDTSGAITTIDSGTLTVSADITLATS